MSIFGDLDAETVPDNPNLVESGDYVGEVSNAYFKTVTPRDGGEPFRQLHFTYVITDEDSPFHNGRVTQYFNLYEYTKEQREMLPKSEQVKIDKSNAKLKQTLCGNSKISSHKGLGVDPSDLNDPDWDPKSVKGTKIKFGVYLSSNGNNGVNWVNLLEND